jgi:CheY-like chemotaxis protein
MSTHSNGLVIIVEDDEYSVEVLGHFLETGDIKYHVCTDTQEVISALQTYPEVDAIFVDLELSEENGYDILKAIQNRAKWDAVPVVAYTSHTYQKSQARDAGFHSFLGKPLNSAVFFDQLQRILNKQQVWD